MSTLEFQKALVQLVKMPANNRGAELESFLAEFDLTQSEQWQLRSLSVSPFLKSFATLQRKKRFGSNVMEVFPMGMRLMGQELSLSIYYDHFEPKHIATPEETKPEEFIRFMRQYTKGISEQPWSECISDILEYEYCEYKLLGGHTAKIWSPNIDSVLSPDAPFLMRNFNFDIIPFFEEVREMDEVEAQKEKDRRDSEQLQEIKFLPEKRDCSILFMKSELEEGEEELEQFEIEIDLVNFLESQLSATPKLPDHEPAFYNDLFEAGLVKPWK